MHKENVKSQWFCKRRSAASGTQEEQEREGYQQNMVSHEIDTTSAREDRISYFYLRFGSLHSSPRLRSIWKQPTFCFQGTEFVQNVWKSCLSKDGILSSTKRCLWHLCFTNPISEKKLISKTLKQNHWAKWTAACNVTQGCHILLPTAASLITETGAVQRGSERNLLQTQIIYTKGIVHCQDVQIQYWWSEIITHQGVTTITKVSFAHTKSYLNVATRFKLLYPDPFEDT